MKEGPTVIKTEHRSCLGCMWLNRRMVRSGRDPEYDHRCDHPGVEHRTLGVSVELEWMNMNVIGTSDRTPGWCPFLAEAAP